MGVGLWLAGRFEAGERSAETWLATLQDWFDEDLAADSVWGNLLTRCRLGRTHDDHPALFVQLHPGAEDVDFFIPQEGRLVVSAKTSVLGPGYHIALCQIVRRLGEDNGVTWEQPGEDGEGSNDDTGYFFDGDPRAVEEEMLLHLRTLAAVVDETLSKSEFGELSLAMPIGHGFQGGPIKTLLGVRDRAWLAKVREDPRHGTDIYAWWEEGLTASFYLGRALSEMWLNVRWRPAEEGEERFDEMENILDDLVQAYRLDPTLTYPWREWVELMDLIGRDAGELDADVRRWAEEAPDGPRIGYRRHPVKVSLADGWRITIPGAMSEEWQEGTWSAWDGERTVWFTCWRFEPRDGGSRPPEDLLRTAHKDFRGELLEHRAGELLGQASVQEYEEDGDEMWNLKAFSAVPGRLALCNIYYHDEDDRSWAIDTWHKLQHDGRQVPKDAEG
jgi:hypothetical protein